MSTKTIAVERRVYKKLAALKRESESFTKVIDRLIEENRRRTVGDLLSELRRNGPDELTEEEASQMERIRRENRLEKIGRPIDLS